MKKLANISNFENLQADANKTMGAISDLSIFNSIESCAEKYIKFYNKAGELLKKAVDSLESRYHPDFSKIDADFDSIQGVLLYYNHYGDLDDVGLYTDVDDDDNELDHPVFLLNMPEEAIYTAIEPFCDFVDCTAGSYKGHYNADDGWLFEEYANGDYDDWNKFKDEVEDYFWDHTSSEAQAAYFNMISHGPAGPEYYQKLWADQKAEAERLKKEKQAQDAAVKRVFGDKNFTVSSDL